MKKISLFIAVTTALLFASCKNEQKDTTNSNKETVTIIHDLGTVAVPKNPERIVVLDYSELEDLDYIGAKVVGIPKSGIPSHLKKYEEDSSIEDLGNVVEINIEKINELQPDLIIIGGRLRESYPQLSKIAPTILTEWDSKDHLKALKKNLDDLGEIFNKKEELNKAYNEVVAKGNRIKAEAEKSDKKALVVLHNKGKMSAYGSGSRFGLIHDVLGVKEAASNLGVHLHGSSVSNEFVMEKNPDILFVVDRSDAIGDKGLNKNDFENPLIKSTNAYKNGKIVYLNSSIWYLSGGGITSINMMMDEIEKAIK